MLLAGNKSEDHIVQHIFKSLIHISFGLIIEMKNKNMSEMHVSSAFVNPLVNGILNTSHSHDPHLSSLNYHDVQNTQGVCQPDFIINVPDDYNVTFIDSFGECKLEGKNQDEDIAIDAYGIGVFSKVTLDDFNLEASLAF